MNQSFLKILWEFYGTSFPIVLAARFKQYWYEIGEYFAWFWSTNEFKRSKSKHLLTLIDRSLVALYTLFIAAVAGSAVLAFSAGRWQLGTALIITYPLLGAHFLALPVLIGKIVWHITHPKKLFRAIICIALERRVKKLRRKYDFTIIVIAGSVGKTSSKMTIAKLLELSGKRVLVQQGNYNDRVTVPLVLFSTKLGSLFSPSAWLSIFHRTRKVLKASEYPYDVVVLELGTDAPGQLRKFAYLRPELAVVTAVAPEHMEYFGTLDAVATEELTVLDFTPQALVNVDDTSAQYLENRQYISYGAAAEANMRILSSTNESLHGQTLRLELGGEKVKAKTPLLGRQGATISLAAASVALLLDIPPATIEENLPNIEAFAGRMRLLPGIKGSTIIDDTYNASPIAVKAALDVMYAAKAPQKIVVLGDMNELGASSAAAHKEIGRYIDLGKVDHVITIGPQGKKYLAAAVKDGAVQTFDSPYDAGAYVASIIKNDALVLFKGSQNRVFAEEAVKSVLRNPADTQKLVRQSKTWLDKKAKQFK